MSIDWAALGQVFGVTLVVTVGIVGLFTVGIAGTSRKAVQEGAAATVAAPGAGARAARWPPSASARRRWPMASI